MSRRWLAIIVAIAAVVGPIVNMHLADGQSDVPSDHDRLCVLEDLAGVDNPWCDPPTTTTEVPPSTSATSTTSVSTTAVPTTTTSTQPPTTAPTTTSTVAPPADFSAAFATPEDFYDRFVRDVHYRDRAARDTSAVWPGDHDEECHGPTTHRDVTAQTDDEVFWWCAPNGPDTGHVMTSMGDVDGYTIISFMPDRIFASDETQQVCWSINLTDEGGRKWTQVVLVPLAAFHANGDRLDYISPVTQDVDQTALPLPADAFMFQNWDHAFRIFSGQTELLDDWDQFHAGDDVARRYRHCLVDNGNGTITITQERNTGTLSRTVNASFPSEFIVIFQDDNYTPDKDGERLGFRTWHWDDIEIR